MRSGCDVSCGLPAVTSPATGLYTSEAAFTDSTTAQASPVASRRPASGTSTNTRSPSDCCAWSVIPISTLPSGSVRNHSWLFVYLRSAGIWLIQLSV
jgi:hypothetical protein